MAQETQGQMKIQAAKAIVARGRSVDIPVQDRTVVGTDENGKPVTRRIVKHFTAGQEVELPLDEIKTLRKSGFLIDPDNAPPPLAEGPQFGSEQSGSVRPA